MQFSLKGKLITFHIHNYAKRNFTTGVITTDRTYTAPSNNFESQGFLFESHAIFNHTFYDVVVLLKSLRITVSWLRINYGKRNMTFPIQ